MRHPLAAVLALALLVVGVLALVWFDVLPGGWTLRGWVVDRDARNERQQRERSEARLAAFAAENAAAPAGSVLFLGSSTIERFPLATAFPDAHCLNRGIGNEAAGECLARLDRSLPRAAPAAFVVYLASIDFRRQATQPAEVARRVAAVLDRLQGRYPDAPILQIGLLSERDAGPAFVSHWRATNAALERAARARGVLWLSVDRSPITDSEGRLGAAVAADDLHLNDEGYRHLAHWILTGGGPVAALLRPAH